MPFVEFGISGTIVQTLISQTRREVRADGDGNFASAENGKYVVVL